MWILAALFAAFAIAMIYQETSGDIQRPWAECKENLVQQMVTGDCTPRSGGVFAPRPGAPAPGAGSQGADSQETTPPDPADRPVGEIRLK